ncbi:MAG: helix-turn-helix domain-containing protein [Sphingomonadales bacterium]|nr:helix-turn-helix domain-containing protein [Sphingomonadales bacterium]
MAQFDVLPVNQIAGKATMDSMPVRCRSCGVRDTALCASLGDGELSALHDIGRRRIIPAGQVVSWAGDPNAICANIVRGVLKVTASMADGREQIVGLLYSGDFVGQLFAEESSLTVIALTETDLCCYSRTSFEHVLDDFPRLERMLLKRTMSSLNDARERMLRLGRQNAQERVAGFILDVALREGLEDEEGELNVVLPISRGEMADFLGLTIETVSRQLTRLKTDGVIAFAKGDRVCTIPERERLEAIVNPF